MARWRKRKVSFDGGEITINVNPSAFDTPTISIPGFVDPERVMHPNVAEREVEEGAAMILPGARLLHGRHEIWNGEEDVPHSFNFDGWYLTKEGEQPVRIGGAGEYYVPTDEEETVVGKWSVGEEDDGFVVPRRSWAQRVYVKETIYEEYIKPDEDDDETWRIGKLEWDITARRDGTLSTSISSVTAEVWSNGQILREWAYKRTRVDDEEIVVVEWAEWNELPDAGVTEDGEWVISYPWGRPPDVRIAAGGASCSGSYTIPYRVGNRLIGGAIISQARMRSIDRSLCSENSFFGLGPADLRHAPNNDLMYGAVARSDEELARPLVNYR